ncbi:MAG: PilT/PilU family type 4a pilus ATPase [Phycisphaerae bacterium]|nr:PilT/PilU family type 4a pilus ATPase [Phycisphaerae bacterium]
MNDQTTTCTNEMETLLLEMISRQASDLHIVPGYRASFRIHGEVAEYGDRRLDTASACHMIESVLPEQAREHLHHHKNADCSLTLPTSEGLERYRASVFYSRGQLAACFRHIPSRIPDFDWMSFPRGLAERMIRQVNGLIIVTGITGSGKSTTLAALVNLLNEAGGYRIITVEEPVEYLFPHCPNSIVTQREVGTDVDSFFDGLKYGLRQDPDVMLVGEIRDRDTARMALSAAETGHLVLTTLHTKDAKGAITRFVDLFPHDAQDSVRTQLALSLRFVVSQHLLRNTVPGEKRVLALEVLVVNDPVRVGIKLGKIESIESAIQTGARDGMITLDASLQQLVKSHKIDSGTARRYAKHT